MDVEFAQSELALVETDRAAQTGLPVAVISAARQRLALLRAAPDFEMLGRWKSFGPVSCAGLTADHAVVISPEWSMQVRIDQGIRPKATITEIKQYTGGQLNE